MKWQKYLGVLASFCILIACFLNWAYYPDIDKHFTGFFTEKNFYGKPGYLFSVLAVLGIIFHVITATWAKRVNLIVAAICMAYALKCYFTFGSAYAGVVPVKELGLYLMLCAALVNVVCSMFAPIHSKPLS